MNNNIKKGIIPYLGFFALVVAILFLLGGTGYENHNITYEQFIEYAKSEKESEQIEYIDVTANSSSGVYTVTGQLNGYEDKETFSFSIEGVNIGALFNASFAKETASGVPIIFLYKLFEKKYRFFS